VLRPTRFSSRSMSYPNWRNKPGTLDEELFTKPRGRGAPRTSPVRCFTDLANYELYVISPV